MTDFSTMRTICFTGPRPNKLYGYKNKEKYQKLVDCIHDFLRGFCRIESDEILTVITGGAQGIDQLAFWAANSLKKEYSLKNEVYIPFVGQEELWNETGLFGKKERNKEMVDNSQMIVGLYPLNKDFTKDRNSGTASCLRYAKGKIPICLIDPESHLIEFHPCNE